MDAGSDVFVRHAAEIGAVRRQSSVIITARNAQSQKNEWKERAVLNADGGLVLGTAAGWIVGRHDDRAGDKGGAGVTWSNGAHWRRVQSAPLQACGTPFPMVKES